MPYSIFHDLRVLRQAHIIARRSKRSKNAIVKFEMAETENLLKLQQEMRDKTYKQGGYFHFMVQEPKKRQIQAIPYRDRIIQHILCDHVLTPFFTPKVIYDNTACIKGKGQHFAAHRLKEFMWKFWNQHRLDGWFLKCDILKYFPSLPHDVIKKQIGDKIEDPDIHELFNTIIDSYVTPDDFLDKYNIPRTQKKFVKGVGFREIPIKRGVPIGNQTSQTIGMYYLNSIDRFVKEKLRVKYYVRYMDDFILLHHDREFLVNALAQIREKLAKELKIQLNDKTQMFPVKNGVKFLGLHFYIKPEGTVVTKIQQRTVKSFKSRVKLINKYYPNPYLDKGKARSILASYNGHFKHTNSHGKVKQLGRKINKQIKADIYKQDPKERRNEIQTALFAPLEDL